MTHDKPQQLSLEAIETTLAVPHRARPDMQSRNAFARVPFPEYFGVDPVFFDEVTPEAYEQSAPEAIEPKLYRRTRFSLLSPDRSVGYVLFSGGELSAIIDHPEAYANRVQARYTTSMSAMVKPQEERNAAALRAGAHALEDKIIPMHNLAVGYHNRINNLRALQRRIPAHWYAHSIEIDMRFLADATRGGMIDTLHAVADVDGWSQDELRLALVGLDKRLMEGRGKLRMDEKKEAWMGLSRVIGNYTIAKKVIVRDRILRSSFDINNRLKKGQKV
jgi:hypothetical protein